MVLASECEMNCLDRSMVFKVCSEGTVGPQWGQVRALSFSGSQRAAAF